MAKEGSRQRCRWVDLENQLYVEYHDLEWGIPVHEDRILFEMLVLEGAQAGLSWATILAKRENYRQAFNDFNAEKVSMFDSEMIEELLQNKGIVRNRLKVQSAIKNAKVFNEIKKERGSFDRYIWDFVEGKQIQNHYKETKDVPTETEVSRKISRDLKRRGMSFVGPTIIYAYMQAIGMVDNHEKGCFRCNEYDEC